MYVYYNNNPEGIKIGDCVVRAISKSLDQPWERTYVGLCLKGFEFADMPSSNAIWGAYLIDKGFIRRTLPNTCPNCYTIADFARDFPEGRYVVATGSHAVAIIDGVVYDTWDSSNEVVAYYFERRD